MSEVLLLAVNDWSNVGWMMAESLKAVGIDASMLKVYSHYLQYHQEAKLATFQEIYKATEKARVVHFMASQFILRLPLEGKKIVLDHCGSAYRSTSAELNAYMNPLVDYTIVETMDLMGLGAKNEVLVHSPIDTGYLQPDFNKSPRSKKLVIGHFPSSTKTKGSDQIVQVLDKYKDLVDFYIETGEPVKWAENIERVKQCDVIIDCFKPTLHDGKPYGEWGNTTKEAAALGKIVITNSLHVDRYCLEYGTVPAIQIANDVEQLDRAMEFLLGLSDDQIRTAKVRAREWVVANHGFEATGKRLKEKVYDKLLSKEKTWAAKPRNATPVTGHI